MIKKIILGLVAGLICGLFAAGGGLILVPMYIYLLKIDEVKARATSVFSILPMVFTSGIMYFKQDYIDWKIGILCSIGGVFGGIIGSKFLKKFSIKTLKILFTIFLFYSSIRLLI